MWSLCPCGYALGLDEEDEEDTMNHLRQCPEHNKERQTIINQDGLYRKYDVSRVDGKDAPGERHDKCRLFVLDIDHDPFARKALEAYATACRHEYPELAMDLFGWLDR